MSTPAQNVPDAFQDVLDLPGAPPVNQVEVNRRNADVARHKRKATVATTAIKRFEAQLKNKKLTAVQRKEITRRLNITRTTLKTANIDAGTAQNLSWKASGDFDKLLGGDNRDAYMALQSMFGQMGLGSLAGKIFDFVKQGYGADTIGLLLQDTPEYKERFAANETRKKAGLPVLNPAEYLSAEGAYRQILDSAGMPKGFYDNPADFRSWIAGDVSPTEIKSRVDMATEAVDKTDPNYRAALYQMYGIQGQDLAAYFLDRKLAEPILKKQAAASAIGAAALRRGFGLNSLDLEGYASLGITGADAEQAYGQIAGGFESMLGIAGRFGSTWTQKDAEQEVFTPGASGSLAGENAAEKGKRLKSAERAMFSGSRGSSTQGLAAGGGMR